MSFWSRAAARSLRRRAPRALLLTIAACAATLCGPVAAEASRLETFDLPSTQGNIKPGVVRFNGPVDKLAATVLLPDGYDEQPERRWPVLYLLHGIGDDTSTWADRDFGDMVRRAAGVPAIIVMPEGGRSYWVDHWLGGKRSGANWGSYILEEVIPTIERRYRIAPGRANHATAGLSAGGYGAMVLAAQLPTYFGAGASLSGLLDLESWGAKYLVPLFGSTSYTRMWGPIGGPYAKSTSPRALLSNLRRSRLYVTSGSGFVDPVQRYDIAKIVLGGGAEVASLYDATKFAGSARARRVDVTTWFTGGAHTWLHWRRAMTRVFGWNPFAPAQDLQTTADTPLTYRTMAGHGNAWGLGFRFDALPTRLVEITRAGQTVSATGRGRVTITPGAADDDASGAGSLVDCRFTADLPFTRTLPAGC